jgi:thioesterase domain-containing protein
MADAPTTPTSASRVAERAGIVSPMPTSTMVELLTPIWQRVLQLPSVGIDDNFFELGGDSALALELFHQVALAGGRELPPVVIYHAPTISALAALLEQSDTPRIPPLIQLKAGSEPPVFIAHGLGGSAMDFFQIVKHMLTPQAIYGMQAKGIDGVEEPLDRIEDMARYALEAVREKQPGGPYFLIGFSLGGLVALEMAQQLIAQGARIGLLAMLDSYPYSGHLSFEQRTRLVARQSWRWVAARLQWLGVPAPYRTTLDLPPSPSQQRFRDSDHLALEHYRPRFYPGKINFVRAAIPTDFPANPEAIWSQLAQSLEVDSVSGDHLGIMTTHFEDLAAVLSRHLAEIPQK